MDVFERIAHALEAGVDETVLAFGQYRIQSVIDGGEQSRVFEVSNRIGKRLALKIFRRPTSPDPGIVQQGIGRLINEVKLLRPLHHKNIVKVYTGGTAAYSDTGQPWHVEEGFPAVEPYDAKLLYYCIMEYIEGKDTSSIFPELNGDPESTMRISDRLRLFEELVVQVCDAIQYYHSKKITHKDIKPKNIRYCTEDSTFVVVDFGFARNIHSPQDQLAVRRADYLDIHSILVGDYYKNDVAQFAMILQKVLPSFKDQYGTNRYEGLESGLGKATDPALERRHTTVLEFYNSLRQYFVVLPPWKFVIRLDEHLTSRRFARFDSKLNIPVSGLIPLSKEVRALVDSREFQRLRGLRQLGPAFFVFPGAVHTRFEHSLGAYFLSLRYIEELMRLPTFGELCAPMDETIKLIVLSCLLHDIGHFPYSHWIEEIDQFPGGMEFQKHDARASEIICNGHLQQLIEGDWGVDPQLLSDIIAARGSGEKARLINSLINSVIDIDKIDYLVRDSIHCGVPYGRGIDIERLLSSLYIDLDTRRICVTDKGRSSLLSVLTCRNIMYQEVYWHKTVRACDAMLKRFFYEYIKAEIDDAETIKAYLDYADDQFVATLLSRWNEHCERKRPDKDLSKLISPFALRARLLYKPAYVFFQANAFQEPMNTESFFTRVLDSSSYSDLVVQSEKLVGLLKDDIPEIEPLDIIIDKTPWRASHDSYRLGGFRIWNTRKKIFQSPPYELQALSTYLDNNGQAYIFCHPKHYSTMQKLALEGRLNRILGEM